MEDKEAFFRILMFDFTSGNSVCTMLVLNDYIESIDYQQGMLFKLPKLIRKKHGNSYFGRFINLWSALSTKRQLNVLNKELTSFILQGIGLLSEIESNKEGLLGKDLRELIEPVEGWIRMAVDGLRTIEDHRAISPSSSVKLLDNCHEKIEKSIEVLYSILRILKKLNQKKNIETTQLAIDLSKHSMNTLANRNNGH